MCNSTEIDVCAWRIQHTIFVKHTKDEGIRNDSVEMSMLIEGNRLETELQVHRTRRREKTENKFTFFHSIVATVAVALDLSCRVLSAHDLLDDHSCKKSPSLNYGFPLCTRFISDFNIISLAVENKWRPICDLIERILFNDHHIGTHT